MTETTTSHTVNEIDSQNSTASSSNSSAFSVGSRRKLSRRMKRINLGYQILMSFLFGANLFLITMTNSTIDIPKLYFEISSALLSILPVVWSKILDACKEVDVGLTPPDSPPELSLGHSRSQSHIDTTDEEHVETEQ